MKSLLDAPIRYGDRVVGVVCHEHVEQRVAFSPDAESYAASLADFAARALAAADRAANERDLRAAYERLGQLNRRLEAAKEEERRFLAHELHDELGQALTALKLRLQIGGRVPDGRPASAAAAAATDAIAIVDNLIARVRKMSVDLRPPLLDEVGLVPALRAYLHAQATLSGVTMDLEDDRRGRRARRRAAAGRDGDRVFSRRAGVDHQRVAACAAAQDHVRIGRQPQSVWLAVQDDGRGFDTTTTLEAPPPAATLASLACASARGPAAARSSSSRGRATGPRSRSSFRRRRLAAPARSAGVWLLFLMRSETAPAARSDRRLFL